MQDDVELRLNGIHEEILALDGQMDRVEEKINMILMMLETLFEEDEEEETEEDYSNEGWIEDLDSWKDN